MEEIIETTPDSDTEILTEEHLPYLYRLLHRVAADWVGIALCLNVRNRQQIGRDSIGVDYALALVLQDWLKSGESSWKKLLNAIKSPVGANHRALAMKIALSYQKAFEFKPADIARSVDVEMLDSSDKTLQRIRTLLGNKVAARWYQMGIVMGVNIEQLEIIRLDPTGRPVSERETAMISSWLRQSLLPQTWQVLVDAVQHEAGGQNKALAKSIAAQLKQTVTSSS